MTAHEPGKVVMSPAAKRVAAFIGEHEAWEGIDSHIRTTGEYGTETRLSLTSRDLKLMLNEMSTIAHLLEEERAKNAQLRAAMERGRKGIWD